jgi:hypothetical protein
MELMNAGLRWLFRLGFWAVLALCLGRPAAHAQVPVHNYTIRDGRMFIELGGKLKRPALDSFVTRYNLDGIGLYQFILGGSMDSLKAAGWRLEMKEQNMSVLSKPLLSNSDIGTTAGQLLLTEIHPRTEELFPAVNNGLQYGYNRFRHKAPFAAKDGSIVFFLRNNAQARRVTLAGSFNNWSTHSTPMVQVDSGWIASVKLSPGKYWYKFIADGNWMIDEDNSSRENDGAGNTNSVFYVTNTLFVLHGFTDARKVSLAGSFNDWRAGQLQLTKTAEGWELPLYLAEGTHTYRFVVNGNWMADPGNNQRLPNEFGDFNSVIRLGTPRLFELPGYAGAHQVALTGSFNHWRPDELLMDKTPSGWRYFYTLGPGNYEYRFIVDRKTVIKNPWLVIDPNYTFHLKGYAASKSVYLAGDFDNWDANALSMTHQGDEWLYSVHLSAGKHLYKFIVDGEWIKDPGNELWEQNEQGTGNSILWMVK